MSNRAPRKRARVDPKMPVAWHLKQFEVTAREREVCRKAAKALAEGEREDEPGQKNTGPGSIIDRELPDTGWRRRARLCEVALEMEREAS